MHLREPRGFSAASAVGDTGLSTVQTSLVLPVRPTRERAHQVIEGMKEQRKKTLITLSKIETNTLS